MIASTNETEQNIMNINQNTLNGYAFNTAAILEELSQLKLTTFKALTKEIKDLAVASGFAKEWEKAEFWALSQHNVTVA